MSETISGWNEMEGYIKERIQVENKKKFHAKAIQSRNLAMKIGEITCWIFPWIFILFVFVYTFFFLFYMNKSHNYPGNAVANGGFYLHAITGCIYFLSGAIQFFSPLRQRFPTFHRFTGYVFYVMVVITSIGILILSYTIPYGGTFTKSVIPIVLPFWLIVNYLAFRAIATFKDVELHRKYNIIGFCLSSSIIFMRIGILFFGSIEKSWPIELTLGLSMWFLFCISALISILYIYFAYERRIHHKLQLQLNGEMGLTQPKLDKFIKIELINLRKLDKRTLVLTFQYPNFLSISFPPGSHISLYYQGVVREYSPICNQPDHFDIVVRLVENGKMSNKLLMLYSEQQQHKLSTKDFFIYGPLFPLPSRFGYIPSQIKSDLNISKLILIGGGTGVAPFINILRSALLNKYDKTQLVAVFNCGTDHLLEYIESLTYSLKKSETEPQRFELIIQKERFDISSIRNHLDNSVAVWVCGPTPMSLSIKQNLLSFGIKRQQIFLLGIEDR